MFKIKKGDHLKMEGGFSNNDNQSLNEEFKTKLNEQNED